MPKFNLNKATRIKTSQGEVAKLKVGPFIWIAPPKYDTRTQAILDYATAQGYTLPSDIAAMDTLIRAMVAYGIWDKLDLYYNFSGDGDTNFKLINWINPGTYNGTAYGGLTWGSSGVTGNGTNGYIDTNFNPALLATGQKYQLNNASRIIVASAVSGYDTLDGASDYYNMLTINGGVRFNSDSNIVTTGISLTGLTVLSKTQANVDVVNKDILRTFALYSTRIYSGVQTIHRRGAMYGNQRISMYGLGAAISLPIAQQFRTDYNNYLTKIGLSPIA